ncbi:putative BYS1 domain protein [Aspergillus homomorphus CBS 101889]|uniref:Putative BYS1 domain protein n=1 Tax=Aspergillus homomorphus (strain CBS 101889) TaxID=1450537 RepID=A0A395HUE4_ASPHC|nr:putative BYS1 domain protein [Aspergillus homomorphus CBS 101889]RAL11156.1 putative BYS1 domain protein [Aspergillus homomorphus CBS 101889]
MHFTTTLLTTAALLLPSVAAAGNAVVTNNCNVPIYLWSVGGSVGPKQTIQPGASYSEALHYDSASGGVSLKITKTPNGLYDGSPQLNYAYTLDGSKTWYDMSSVFGDPFAGSVVAIKPSDTSCPKICWSNGVNPGGSQVKTCQTGSNEVLTVCAPGC